MREHVSSASLLTLILAAALAGCGTGTEKPAPADSATAVATAPPPPPPASTPAPAASAAPSAEPAAGGDPGGEDADEKKPGAVHIHLASTRVVSGKAEAAEKTLKLHMLKLRRKCIGPHVKKGEILDGSLKVTLEVEKDGEIKKAITKVTTGKVPEEIEKCVGNFYEKEIHLEPKGKAKIEAIIEMGPKVQPDK